MKVGEGAPPSFIPVILTVVSAPAVFGTGTVQKVFKSVGWCCWWEAVTRFLFVLPQNWKKLDVGTCWRQEIHPALYILMASPSCYYLCHSENQKLASPALKKSTTLCSPPASFLMTSDTYCPKKQLHTRHCTMCKSFLRTCSGEMVVLWS